MALSGNEGYIYVIHCTGSLHYKIGITRKDIESRVLALQIGCPHKLQLVMAFWTNEPEEVEARLHELLALYCVRGEWFRLDAQAFCNVILTINPLMADHVQLKTSNPMMVGYVPLKE